MKSRDPVELQQWLDIPDVLSAEEVHAGPVEVAGAELTREALREPSPTREQLRARRLYAALGALAWLASMLLLTRVRPDLEERAAEAFSQSLVWLAMAGIAVYSAMAPGRFGLGLSRHVLVRVALGIVLVAFAMQALWSTSGVPEYALGPARALAGCLTVGLVVAGAPLALGIWTLARAFPVGGLERRLTIGVASGLSATALLTLHCASPFLGHLLVAHALPVLVGALVAVLVRR